MINSLGRLTIFSKITLEEQLRILYNTKKNGEIYTEKVNQALKIHNKISNFHDLRV